MGKLGLEKVDNVLGNDLGLGQGDAVVLAKVIESVLENERLAFGSKTRKLANFVLAAEVDKMGKYCLSGLGKGKILGKSIGDLGTDTVYLDQGKETLRILGQKSFGRRIDLAVGKKIIKLFENRIPYSRNIVESFGIFLPDRIERMGVIVKLVDEIVVGLGAKVWLALDLVDSGDTLQKINDKFIGEFGVDHGVAIVYISVPLRVHGAAV